MSVLKDPSIEVVPVLTPSRVAGAPLGAPVPPSPSRVPKPMARQLLEISKEGDPNQQQSKLWTDAFVGCLLPTKPPLSSSG